MKVLLTGGTGFLGRQLVRELRPRHALRLLVRSERAVASFDGASPSPAPAGEGRGEGSLDFALGDVTDRASLERAAAGCDAILHAAALVKILAPAAEFDRVNVGGLDNVLAAAAAAGVGQVLYVSSFIALGPSEGRPGGVHDESSPPDDRAWINPYERTKTLADRRARAAIAAGAPLQVVYPGVIYGPGEMTEGNIVLRHVLDLLHRRLPALVGRPERRWNYVHVADVAAGVRRVLEKAPAGSRWVLGGENVTLGEFYGLVEELSGVRVPRRRLPDGVAKLAGALQRWWAGLRGTTPQLTPDLVEIYRHDWALSSARAQAELGYRPRALRDGLGSSLAWLRETGQWRG